MSNISPIFVVPESLSQILPADGLSDPAPGSLAHTAAFLQDRAETLNAALVSRTIIDLAAGIVMGQNKCSQSAAIAIMKATVSQRHLKLRRLAAELVCSVTDEVPVTHVE